MPTNGRRPRLTIAILLGLAAGTGCPRRFDPRADEIRTPAQEAERARYQRGLAAFRQGSLAEAETLLAPFSDRIVDTDDGTELHATLAELYRRTGKVREALREYERFYRGAGVHPVEQAYVQRQAGRLIASLPPDEQRDLRRRFDLPPAEAPPPAAARGVPIGLLLPLSGKERPLGERVLRGALWGADLLGGAAAGPAGVELRVRDLGTAPEQAAEAVAELAREGVVALIAPPGRQREASRLAEAAGRHGLPVLDLGPAGDEPGPGAVFALLHGNAARARALVQQLQRQGIKTAAILAPATAYGRTMTQLFTRELGQRAVRLLKALTFPEGATTFVAQARELLALQPEALLVPVSAQQLELIAAQLVATGVIATQNVPTAGKLRLLLSTADGFGERLLRNAGRYLQGAVLAPLSPGGVTVDDPALAAPAARFQQRFGEEPGALDALGHDAVRAVLAACEADRQVECGPAQVAGRLSAIRIDGATGPIAFLPGGQRAGGPLLLQVDGAGVRVLKSEPRP